MKKNNKSFLTILVVMVSTALILSLSACGNNNSNPEAQSLYARGLEVVQLMSEMTKTEEYVDIHTGSSEIKEIVQSIASGDYSAPKAVYSIFVTDENLAAMAELGSLENVSENLSTFLTQRVLGSLMTQINGLSGVEKLAASSVCTAGMTFVDENADKNLIYLYTYEDAFPVAVTFVLGEDHTVSASGVFVMYDEFTCNSADEIETFFSDIVVEVAEVLPEK